jgi:hypothetical protein
MRLAEANADKVAAAHSDMTESSAASSLSRTTTRLVDSGGSQQR